MLKHSALTYKNSPRSNLIRSSITWAEANTVAFLLRDVPLEATAGGSESLLQQASASVNLTPPDNTELALCRLVPSSWNKLPQRSFS